MTATAPLEVELEELLAMLGRSGLSEAEQSVLRSVCVAYAHVVQELQRKHTTIARLQKMFFGAPTEKTATLKAQRTQEGDSPGSAGGAAVPDVAAHAEAGPPPKPKPKRKGHGRNAAARYTGATRVSVPHASLRVGDTCPVCHDGTLYALRTPVVLVRVQGQAPMMATVYEHDRLRCNPCGAVIVAERPAGIGDDKYDATVPAMIGELRFGLGTPHNRIERLQASVGVPLPASTQWRLLHRAVLLVLYVVYQELIRQAAQGDVIHNDDTPAKILELMGKRRKKDEAAKKKRERTGLFTTGIVSVREGGRHIALFFTGPKHAGENLGALLAERSRELPEPIQMCDALSHNRPKLLDAASLPIELHTILANCLAHGRRPFVEIYDHFPEQCLHVLEVLRDVYKNDEIARTQQMSAAERLAWHQRKSGPLMEELEKWLQAELDEKRVEPNSTLGEAMQYLIDHWQALTLFLRVAGAPLDNNVCERALKKAILHRKGSLFYKTLVGALVGDVFMSLIHTAELCGANAFDYLVTLLRRADEVRAAPSEWMPWNYTETRARLDVAA